MAAQSPSPAISPSLSTTSTLIINQSPPSKLPIDFSPPLIAMVALAATAFLTITFSRNLLPPFLRLFRWFRRRRRRPPPYDLESPPPYELSSDGFYVYSPYGLDESIIKSIPLTIFNLPKSSNLGFNINNNNNNNNDDYDDDELFNDCAVCLLEFNDGDYIRTLPMCSHSFHVDCVDMWLRSHATCPLCRAGVFLPSSSPRVRPNFDEGLLLESMFLEPLPENPEISGEIQPARSDDMIFSPGRVIQSEDHHRSSNRRELDYLLKRSYSFGFERSFPSERLVLEPATTPYRRRSLFWTKRHSSTTPFRSFAAKSRVFSLRNIKSPAFFRRRYNNSGGSSRRLKTTSSPMMMKFASASPSPSPAMFSSSRLRCGDPEALLSPERWTRG